MPNARTALSPTLAVLAALALLAGCGGEGGRDAPRFDGQVFRTDARAESRSNRQDFAVTVRDAGKSLEGALEAGRFAGTRHCITYFGTSDIDWTIGPDTPVESLALQGGDLVMPGRCIDGGA